MKPGLNIIIGAASNNSKPSQVSGWLFLCFSKIEHPEQGIAPLPTLLALYLTKHWANRTSIGV